MHIRHAAALALVITALTSAAITPPRHAYAQDVREGYSNPDRSNGDSAGPEEKTDSGCQCTGTDDNIAEGIGNLTLIFDRDHLTNFSFYWNSENFAYGTMKGRISRKKIKFTGNAGDDCTVTGIGKGDDWNLSGEYEFRGKCAEFFEGGTFSTGGYIPCFCTYDPSAREWHAND